MAGSRSTKRGCFSLHTIKSLLSSSPPPPPSRNKQQVCSKWPQAEVTKLRRAGDLNAGDKPVPLVIRRQHVTPPPDHTAAQNRLCVRGWRQLQLRLWRCSCSSSRLWHIHIPLSLQATVWLISERCASCFHLRLDLCGNPLPAPPPRVKNSQFFRLLIHSDVGNYHTEAGRVKISGLIVWETARPTGIV